MAYSDLIIILGGLGLLLAGGAIGFFLKYQFVKHQETQTEEEAEQRALRRIADEERRERLELLEEKDNWYKIKAQQKQEVKDQRVGLVQREKGLSNKDRELTKGNEELRKEWTRLKNDEKRLGQRQQTLKTEEEELGKKMKDYVQRLELVANMTQEEAQQQLLEHLSGEVRARGAAMVRAERIRAKEESEREAKKIIAMAIQRCAVDEVMQASTSTVPLPNESIKSRIIGKEGRNVRAFEVATGVKVVVDDTPDTVLLSSFDAARREVASRAMSRLIADGGFTPGRIEDIVEKCKIDLEQDILQAGKSALMEIEALDFHVDLPHYVGMLKYRTSYGQNLLQHCLEVAHLSGAMAAEMGLDVRMARRAGLLHDIGKTINRETGGSHVEQGIELGEKLDEDPIIKEVIAEHHEDNERLSPICFIVKAADTISSIRPGGRREDSEGYARRIMRLEEIANSFEGVRDVFAINAGREIRVMVRGEQVGDDDAEMLAFDIAERVKSEMRFAGEVKVMVVRETRAVRYTGKTGRTRRSGQGRRRPGRGAKSNNGNGFSRN
jgi:ribonuclease Y